MKKRIAALFLSAFIVIGAVPFGATAEAVKNSEETITTAVLPLGRRESTYRPISKKSDGEVTLTHNGEQVIVCDAARLAAPSSVPKKFESAMVAAAKAYTVKTDISELGLSVKKTVDGEKIKYTAPQFNEYCQAVIDKYPELFNIKNFGCSFNTETLKISNLTLEFAYGKEDYDRMMTRCDAVADSIISDLKNSDFTDLEKALLLHDRIAVICEYDYANFEKWRQGDDTAIPQDSFNMYGTLINHISVCQGYATAYRYMLNKLGINNYLCSSNALNHVWNIVEIGGEYYHVDITWDDPSEDITNRVDHYNFLLSTEALRNGSGHSAYDYDTAPDSTLYDGAFWNNYNTAFVALNGALYGIYNGIDSDGGYNGGVVTEFNDNSKYDNEPAEILRLPDQYWPAGGHQYWKGSFSRLSADSEHLYFNTATGIYSFNLSKNIATKIYELDADSKAQNFAIYGFKKSNNKFTVEPNTSPSFTNRTKSLYGFVLTSTDTLAFDESTVSVAGLETGYTYTGSSIAPKLTVLYGDELLKEGQDYTVSFTNNKNVGTAVAEICGSGAYEGKIQKSFTVKPASVNAAVISGIGDRTYTGKAVTVSPTLKYGGKYLKNGTDYTLSYKNNKYTGRASVTVTGKGNFTGSVTKYFYIHPAKVTGIKQTGATASTVKISWKKSASGTGYAVLRATSKNGKYSTVKIINSLKTTTFTDTKREANKTYYYKVAAFKTVSGVRYTSPASSVLYGKTSTKAPKISSYKNQKGKKAKISWNKVSGASGYQLYVSTKKGSGYKCVYSGNKRTYTVKNLKKNKTYYFKVRTYKKATGCNAYSSFSGRKKLKIKK